MKPLLLAGIDVGTTKTMTLIAQVTPDVGLELLGVGNYPSTGLRKGLVVDLDRTIAAIEESLAAAERMAGERISQVYLGVTGSHLQTHPTTGAIAVSNPDKGISNEDVARVLEIAKAKDFGPGRKLVATLVREYIVDGQDGIRNPRGMSALHLEVTALLVSGDTASLENLHRAATSAHLNVEEMFLQPIASGEAVLTPEEMEQGTVLVDIGGGTSDVAVYLDGAVAYTFVIPVGGDHFDSDLAYAFELEPAQAEWLKLHHGGVRQASFQSPIVAHLPFPNVKTPHVAEKLIAEVLRPRAEELMELVREELLRTNLLYHLHGGCVLTGGGSQLEGLTELAHHYLGLPTRMGRPHGLAGRREDLQSPTMATAVGLVKLAYREVGARQTHPHGVEPAGGFVQGLMGLINHGAQRFVQWVSGY